MFLEILCWCSFFLVECFEFLYDNYREILVLPFHIKKTLRLRNRLSKEYYNLFFQQTQHRIYKVDSRETKEISTVVTILFTSHNLISWTIRSKKDQMVVKKLKVDSFCSDYIFLFKEKLSQVYFTVWLTVQRGILVHNASNKHIRVVQNAQTICLNVNKNIFRKNVGSMFVV